MAIIRPDLRYEDLLDINAFKLAILSNSIVVPTWQSWLDGMNDRFSYGAVQPMAYVGRRYDVVLEFAEIERLVDAEKFMRWIVIKVLNNQGIILNG